MEPANSRYGILSGVAALLTAVMLTPDPTAAADLRVMKTGLGSGTVTSATPGINCGGDCDETYASAVSVTLAATAPAGSAFVKWEGDCTEGAPGTCTVTMGEDRSVRAVFALQPAIPLLTDCEKDSGCAPEKIQDYLNTNSTVNTAARFVSALPSEFKQNWILMSRSESLQTGTAEFPRILLPSADAKYVFTLGLTEHPSYPGSHRNAIEYMQWDAADNNFRFHEIVVDAIPAMGSLPARSRGVSIDDIKCSKCHSTQNVLNRSASPGTTGDPPGTIKVKNKPNWDTYDSWGGMMPLNRDRIYQGSVDAAAFRKLFNPWTWRANDTARAIIEQLELQPLENQGQQVPDKDVITRMTGGANDGHTKFKFDTSAPMLEEPIPTGTAASIVTAYSFDGRAGTGAATPVTRGGSSVTLRHMNNLNEGNDEGRGVRLFDALVSLNSQRVAAELKTHRVATGEFPIDVRAIGWAIASGCISIDRANNTVAGTTTALAINLGFFDARNGMRINDLVIDTRDRAHNLTRRKADLQKWNLHRAGDPYVLKNTAVNGLIQQYGYATSAKKDTSMSRLRQEVFRRDIDLGRPDVTAMGGIYVDRESYGNNPDPASPEYTNINTDRIALFRYFLEPLGVSVDKWSTGVRARSGAYAFADLFGSYESAITFGLRESHTPSDPIPGLSEPFGCPELIAAVNSTLSSLPHTDAVPTYPDVQRIFNKACIECHGDLRYPPYVNHGNGLDLSENESPPAGESRLARSHRKASARASSLTGPLYQRIVARDERCPDGAEGPDGMMPCGGPPLSTADIETLRRWIEGGNPRVSGNSHVRTVGGVNYDFQGAGEFVFLRGEDLEIQVRQTAVETASPLGGSRQTGLNSCISVTSAVAVRVGGRRVTYQPNLSGEPDPSGLQLRIDGKLTRLGTRQILLDGAGRIVATAAPGGFQIETTGGTVVAITPGWWNEQQLWYASIDVRRARATQGVMGAIPPGSWLPALPDRTSMGPRPAALGERQRDLYGKFANAWRVGSEASLFDYARGSSTRTFTVENWPGEGAGACRLPRPSARVLTKTAQRRLAPEAAARQCNAVVDSDHRANCVKDVGATGEAGFARTYQLAEQQQRKAFTTVPVIVLPERNKADLAAPVAFTWNRASSADGAPVTYRHCVWDVDKDFTFKDCAAVSGRGRADTVSRTVAQLEPGKAYFWKVIAEDGKGGSAESETRRFTIR